jgi:hypothetical protein
VGFLGLDALPFEGNNVSSIGPEGLAYTHPVPFLSPVSF